MTLPRLKTDRVLLGHGGGGLLTKELLEAVIVPALDNPLLHPLDDAALLPVEGSGGVELAFTTDSYVVSPLFFPGGDIGRLCVAGTVNDLAVKGAQPLWMSLGLVLEEGLAIAELERVISSIAETAQAAGIRVVTGDTKVVERGRGDGLYINTAGIGRVVAPHPLGPSCIKPGDHIIVNGTLGDHGMAIMAQRSGISFSTELRSDCAPLWDLVQMVLESGVELHAMRDLTRGGLAAALCDFAESSGYGLKVRENDLPVRPEVRGACDLLGFEPIAVANEGKIMFVCAAESADLMLATLRAHPLGQEAAVIGEVTAEAPGMALLVTRIGGERIIDMPPGETLPRIC